MATRMERRKFRSPFRGEAANLYLQALAQRHGLRAAVLADEQGLPIAATGPKVAEDPLSAYGAFRTGGGPASPAEGPRSRALRLGEFEVSLTVLGHDELPWSQVGDDLTRILCADA